MKNGLDQLKQMLLLVLLMALVSPLKSLADEKDSAVPQSIYVAIEPALVTNYGGPGRLRYMSVDVSLRVRP